ncbi:helix-turn-helix domain-containing protein [Nitrogeniibacter mangrovi]|uniref:Helix-turn-helix domain-containing protein n=1 Tax=Nitrogeniibacter mangrovi TaxID=2016596 RepID=A0A6C1AXU1_9RHOO|nr:helix-turn-helix domain-containing protein [Nitrogeniibacter mangrovi]QID16172.1 helix-turn-helix domain-containing protein [Nitrogeniibacter mangrovi]
MTEKAAKGASENYPEDMARHARILTRDPCEHAASLPAWSQEYLQLTPGLFEGEISEATFGPVQVFRETIAQCVDEKANPRKNSYTLGVPIRVEPDGLWQGRELVPDSLMSLRPNEELHFRTPPYSSILVTVIDCHALEAFADEVEQSDVDVLMTRPHAEQIRPADAEAFRGTLARTLEMALASPEALRYPAVRDSLSETVMSAALGALEGERASARRCVSGQLVQRAIVERARGYVLANRGRAISVGELCTYLKMSRRGVHHAFMNVLGINAVSFLRYVRLHGVRKDLLAAEPEQTVSSIAFSWGFWHMGMFATYYRQLFGETPSTTLKKRMHRHARMREPVS